MIYLLEWLQGFNNLDICSLTLKDAWKAGIESFLEELIEEGYIACGVQGEEEIRKFMKRFLEK
jgi:hypothetical protein